MPLTLMLAFPSDVGGLLCHFCGFMFLFGAALVIRSVHASHVTVVSVIKMPFCAVMSWILDRGS